MFSEKKKPLVNKGGTLPKYVTPAEETEPRPEDDLELEPFEVQEFRKVHHSNNNY